MATLTFPADQFEIRVDAEAIRGTAGAYGRFGTTAGEVVRTMRGLNSSDWAGTEGFADAVEAAQGKMRSVRADAEQTFASLQGAQRSREGLKEPTDEKVKADPSARSAYDDIKRQMDARIAGLEQAGNWIDETFTDVRDWIEEHVGVFRFIATTLNAIKESTEKWEAVPKGHGLDAVIDGRWLGLTRGKAEQGVKRAIGEARAHGWCLPEWPRIILGRARASTIHEVTNVHL